MCRSLHDLLGHAILVYGALGVRRRSSPPPGWPALRLAYSKPLPLSFVENPEGFVATLYASAPLFLSVAHPGHVKDNGRGSPLMARAGKIALLVERSPLDANKDAVAFG